MFCRNCGKEINETFNHCPFCGTAVDITDTQNNYTNPTTSAPQYTVPQYTPPQYTAPQQPQENTSNIGGFKVLGFFFGLFGPATSMLLPIVSLILYIIWRDDKPKAASAIGKFTIIGLIVGILVLVAVLVISIIIFAVSASYSLFEVLSNFSFDLPIDYNFSI